MGGGIERNCYFSSPFERLLLLHFISDNCYVVLRHFYHPSILALGFFAVVEFCEPWNEHHRKVNCQ
jgi:hypothetical protein